MPGQAVVLGFGAEPLFLGVGVLPLGGRHFKLFPLLIRTPHLFAVLFHSLEVAVADQLQELLVPGFCALRHAAQRGAGHLVMMSLLLVVLMKHPLHFLLFHYLQRDFTHSVDKTMLYCLAKIGPSVGFAHSEEE